MWLIGIEVEQETNAPPPKKNPGSATGIYMTKSEEKRIFSQAMKKQLSLGFVNWLSKDREGNLSLRKQSPVEQVLVTVYINDSSFAFESSVTSGRRVFNERKPSTSPMNACLHDGKLSMPRHECRVKGILKTKL